MALKKYTAKIDLGKVDGYNNGRKSCAAEVRVDYRLEVKTGNGEARLYWEFSASGDIWNNLHTDIICGGQCLDHMNGYASIRDNATFREVYALWKRWHLNGMKAGSPAQREALNDFVYDRNRLSYHWYDKGDINENTDGYGLHYTYSESEAKAADTAGHFMRGERGDWHDQASLFLIAKGLYTDKGYIYEGKPYKYGSAWLVEELPEDVKERIRSLVGITKEEEKRAEVEARKELEKEGAAA